MSNFCPFLVILLLSILNLITCGDPPPNWDKSVPLRNCEGKLYFQDLSLQSDNPNSISPGIDQSEAKFSTKAGTPDECVKLCWGCGYCNHCVFDQSNNNNCTIYKSPNRPCLRSPDTKVLTTEVAPPGNKNLLYCVYCLLDDGTFLWSG